MKAVNAKGQEVLAVLASLVPNVGDAVKLTVPGFMPLAVERIRPTGLSIAHYYEQNGDLMADPEMTFWLAPTDGQFYATGFRNDGIAQDRTSVYFYGNEMPVKFRPREQRGQSSFAGIWMQNLRAQGFFAEAKQRAEIAKAAAETVASALAADLAEQQVDAPAGN